MKLVVCPFAKTHGRTHHSATVKVTFAELKPCYAHKNPLGRQLSLAPPLYKTSGVPVGYSWLAPHSEKSNGGAEQGSRQYTSGLHGPLDHAGSDVTNDALCQRTV